MKPKGAQFAPFSAPHGQTIVAQESLPNALPVTKQRGSSGSMQRSPEETTHEWVPTWELNTAQRNVSIGRLNERSPVDYSMREQTEGQETTLEHGDPQAWTNPNGGRTLIDGNHRTTVERHQGAMFHRLQITGDFGKNPEPADALSYSDTPPFGRYDP